MWRKKLLAKLRPKQRICKLERRISDRSGGLPTHFTNTRRKHIGLGSACSLPRREPSELAVIAIVGEARLSTQKHHFRIQKEGSAVVSRTSVFHREADVDEKSSSETRAQNGRDNLPRVGASVALWQR